ncbi:PTS transporter subunit EIIB [Corynebacterium choanae]|uniref:PTS system glucose-specific EIICBA component n=1 Tax=Corynebacterium choanae TaxID=1862358 RepID=A0A3G6JBU8_9CORY|nr:PTS transporter subunit EIIB [Corynebacterium choanae]AZA14578.1 PTS system glucose-specific EIICBA component [Corynebacterium choanae]
MLQLNTVIAGLGGANNIRDITGCITRLRCLVHDPQRVDETLLQAGGCTDIRRSGDRIQIPVGLEAEVIADQLNDALGR